MTTTQDINKVEYLTPMHL